LTVATTATTAKVPTGPLAFDRFATAVLESYGNPPYTTRYAVSRAPEILAERTT
jgi:hypothetical protein